MTTKFKYFFSTLILIVLVSLFFLNEQSDGKLHLFFCDVGQGDAAYIRFPDNTDMLIDGGPGNAVLDCLSDNMPFYDREINVVMLTHPQADHLNGLIPVLERYRVLYFVSSPVGNSTLGYQKLQDIIRQKKIEVKNLYADQSIDFGKVKFTSLWPEKNWLVGKINCGNNKNCSALALGNSSVLGISTDNNLNNFSLMGVLSYGDFDVFFTGDGDSQVQDELLKFNSGFSGKNKLEVMKVPHHGAKTALTKNFLASFTPELAVISVGKNNRYGHPSPELLQMLSKYIKTIKRTDLDGTIEVVSDGLQWFVR